MIVITRAKIFASGLIATIAAIVNIQALTLANSEGVGVLMLMTFVSHN